MQGGLGYLKLDQMQALNIIFATVVIAGRFGSFKAGPDAGPEPYTHHPTNTIV